MTYVLVSPETVGWVAADVESIGASLAGSHAAAAGLTTGVASAAVDEVSTAIATLFSNTLRAIRSSPRRRRRFMTGSCKR